jgi:hypothetical protein
MFVTYKTKPSKNIEEWLLTKGDSRALFFFLPVACVEFEGGGNGRGCWLW